RQGRRQVHGAQYFRRRDVSEAVPETAHAVADRRLRRPRTPARRRGGGWVAPPFFPTPPLHAVVEQGLGGLRRRPPRSRTSCSMPHNCRSWSADRRKLYGPKCSIG